MDAARAVQGSDGRAGIKQKRAGAAKSLLRMPRHREELAQTFECGVDLDAHDGCIMPPDAAAGKGGLPRGLIVCCRRTAGQL